MSKISSSTITSKKTTREIRIFRQNSRFLLVKKLKHVESVVVLGRAPVLGCQPVINGDNHGRDLARKTAANGVVRLGIGRQVHEPPAVEEDDHGEGLGCGGWDEDADPEVAGRVDGDVVGFDAVDGLGVGW